MAGTRSCHLFHHSKRRPGHLARHPPEAFGILREKGIDLVPLIQVGDTRRAVPQVEPSPRARDARRFQPRRIGPRQIIGSMLPLLASWSAARNAW